MVRTEFARHTIRVETSLAAELPVVLGDAIQLQQVILNLLMNAAEAARDVVAERRFVTVRTEVRHAEPRNMSRWKCATRVLESVKRIFPGFSRRSTPPSLAAWAWAVGQQGYYRAPWGRLWVTANTDHGATFHFFHSGSRREHAGARRPSRR